LFFTFINSIRIIFLIKSIDLLIWWQKYSMAIWWQGIYQRKIIFRKERTSVQLILSCKHQIRPFSLCEYSMIEFGITAHKLRNFSISWNTIARGGHCRWTGLAQVRTWSNGNYVDWKANTSVACVTRRNEDSRLQLFAENILGSPTDSLSGRTKTHLSKHLRGTFRNLVIFPSKIVTVI